MPPKNNITEEKVYSILNKEAPEVFDILNKPINEVLPIIKTLSEEMLEDLISIDKRNGVVSACQHRLNYLTRKADLVFIIDKHLNGDIDRDEVIKRTRMSDHVLDCAIDIYKKKDRGSKGRKPKQKPLFPLNKRLHNVSWGAKLDIETHWYIPYHMYESLI